MIGQEERTLEQLIHGYVETMLVHAVVRAGLPELLRDGPEEIGELAERGGWRRGPLVRLMRGWVRIGLCGVLPDGRYELTEKGRGLLEDSGLPWRDLALLAVEQYLPAFARLDGTLRDGGLPFVQAHGMPPFEYRREVPEAGILFNRWLAAETAGHAAALAAAYDWGRFPVIVDIAGGNGRLARAVARAAPAARVILFEQPHVVAALAGDECWRGHERAVELHGGDMFHDVPGGAGLYVLKSVLHDWPDGEAVRILSNCRAVMGTEASILVIERLLDEDGGHADTTLMVDLHMLAVTGGVERSRAEFASLAEAAGLSMIRVMPTGTPFHLIELKAF